MTNKERWLSAWALLVSILPFILVASVLQLLPDKIILPTLIEGEKLLLSKYQYLYLGLFGFVPAVLVIISRILRERNFVERNFMFMVIASLCLGAVFLLTAIYVVLYHIHIYKIDLLKKFEFFGASAIVISLFGGMLANFFPQLRRNDVFGLKNKYTMGDSRIWSRVHHVAADVYMGAFYGFALFSSVLSIWLDYHMGWVHIVLWISVVSALIVWGRLYSRRLGKKIPAPETVHYETK